MSTELINRPREGYQLTGFYGGDARGYCLQISSDHGYVQVTREGAALLAADIFRHFLEVPGPADAACDEVIFVDGVGAGRSSIKSCRDGVQWIMVGGRVYWPLSDLDAKRLQSACCGNGSFDGPTTPAAPPAEGEEIRRKQGGA